MLVLGVVAGSFPAVGVASTTATDELPAALSPSPFFLSRIAASFVLGDASSAPTYPAKAETVFIFCIVGLCPIRVVLLQDFLALLAVLRETTIPSD